MKSNNPSRLQANQLSIVYKSIALIIKGLKVTGEDSRRYFSPD